ncbi:hypothetical protein [Planktotalea arctica]|uniref:hypothetical protein n=1 Tax=Planktotalea arctica TaxID=1481893 RepID=UPI003219E3D6
MRASTPFIIALAATALLGCQKFPELDVSEEQFDAKSPYPKLVPIEELLKEPEPSITGEVQEELTARRDDLQAAPTPGQNSDDPMQNRIDALRARRDVQAASDPLLDADLRKRMERGINAPIAPE